MNRGDGFWVNISRGDFFGQVYDNGEMGSTYLPEEILAENSDILLDEFGRDIGTNDTGNAIGTEFDNLEYDAPIVTSSVVDETYDVVVAEYPEVSFLYVRPFSKLADGYEYRCVISTGGVPDRGCHNRPCQHAN